MVTWLKRNQWNGLKYIKHMETMETMETVETVQYAPVPSFILSRPPLSSLHWQPCVSKLRRRTDSPCYSVKMYIVSMVLDIFITFFTCPFVHSVVELSSLSELGFFSPYFLLCAKEIKLWYQLLVKKTKCLKPFILLYYNVVSIPSLSLSSQTRPFHK